jgi:hypothetical protein
MYILEKLHREDDISKESWKDVLFYRLNPFLLYRVSGLDIRIRQTTWKNSYTFWQWNKVSKF